MKPAWLLLALSAVPMHAAPRPCTADALRAQLLQLESVITRCAPAKTAQACDPGAAGQDDMVRFATGPRLIEFDWLRTVLADASHDNAAAAQLAASSKRLDQELAELSAAPVLQLSEIRRDNAALRSILANGGFPQPQPPSLLRRLWSGFVAWLNAKLQAMAGTGAGTRWLAPLLLLGLLTAACGALFWWFSRVTRSQRLLPWSHAPRQDQNAPIAQDWQLLLEQAAQLAGQQRWREGIHRIYWASIAQMESLGAWRADKARTPREYLELVDRQSPRHGSLVELTRCFEHFWYGGRLAAEQDYVRACALLQKVIAR